MKTFQINIRQPNIDRFFEVLATAQRVGFNFKWFVMGLPENYPLKSCHGNQSNDLMSADFANIYSIPPKGWMFNHKQWETVEDIERRTRSYKIYDIPEVDKTSITLLGHAVEKLDIDRPETVQNTINLASVIALMDEAKEVLPQHIAEAIQYLPKSNIND